MITFFASGDPKGQPRPRAFARKFGDQWQARVYDAKTAEGWKSCVAAAWLQNKPAGFTAYTGPVSVHMEFVLKRPQSHFLKSGLRSTAPVYCQSKPDADNFAKAVLDALTQIGVWGDDAQVCELSIVKRYVPVGATVGATISMRSLIEEANGILRLPT